MFTKETILIQLLIINCTRKLIVTVTQCSIIDSFFNSLYVLARRDKRIGSRSAHSAFVASSSEISIKVGYSLSNQTRRAKRKPPSGYVQNGERQGIVGNRCLVKRRHNVPNY